MNEKNADEIRYRRLAFRLFAKEKSATEILKRIPRSRTWLFKWKKRFEQRRWQALDSLSKAPQRPAKRYDQRVVKLVLRLRHGLQRAEVGLSGARHPERIAGPSTPPDGTGTLDDQSLAHSRRIDSWG
jgi:transposase